MDLVSRRTNLTRMQRRAHSLQVLLWALWIIGIALTAVLTWHAETIAGYALNLLALAIHCGMVGIIGGVVLTWIEQRLQPWRFL